MTTLYSQVVAAIRALPDRDQLLADLLLTDTYLLDTATIVDIVRHVLEQKGIHADTTEAPSNAPEPQ